MSFEGFTAETFATYAPERCSSMVHNLARMKVKGQCLALGRIIGQRLVEDLSGLDMAASDEIPNVSNHKRVDCQWVFWFRDAAARASLASFLRSTPLVKETIFQTATADQHTTLGIVVRQDEVWVGLRAAHAAVVDRRNLTSLLCHDWGRDKLRGLTGEVPDGLVIGLGERRPMAEATDADLDLWSETLVDSPADFSLGFPIARDVAIELGADIADVLARWVGALLPLYRFAAWSRDNDHIEATKQLKEAKAKERKQATSFGVGDRVRITGGVFRGKVGVVENADNRANVRVRLGNMSIKIDGTDLVPA
jgi:hypothetical protein